MIPKIIHYCWFGKHKFNSLSKRCIKTWQKLCPDYSLKLWNEDNFNFATNDFIQNAYNNKLWAFVSDYVRLEVIYRYGGIYLDTDVQLLRPLDELLCFPSFIGIQQDGYYCNTGLGFGAEPENSFVADMLFEYQNVSFDMQNLDVLKCPILNTIPLVRRGYNFNISPLSIQRYNDVTAFSYAYFDPIAMGEGRENVLCDKSFSIHRGAYSWGSPRQQFRRKLVNIIGLENADVIKRLIRSFRS